MTKNKCEAFRHSGNDTMGARKFHEQTGRVEATQWEIAFNQSLVDPLSGLVRENISETRNCPVCLGNEKRQIFIKDGFPHQQCKKCAAIYVSPSLKRDAVLSLFYGPEAPDPFCDVVDSRTQRESDRLRFLWGLSHLKPRSNSKQLLDVGCGTGFFMELAQSAGWRCSGIDPYERAVSKATKFGLNVIRGPFEPGHFAPDSFDAVTFWEVLDHVPDPREFIHEAARLLRVGGCMLIAVRNSNSLAARILQEKCHVFNGAAHYQLFSRHNLEELCCAYRLDPVWCGSYISELSVINNYLDFQDPYLGESAEGLLPLSDEALFSNDLGYKIVVVARKTRDVM